MICATREQGRKQLKSDGPIKICGCPVAGDSVILCRNAFQTLVSMVCGTGQCLCLSCDVAKFYGIPRTGASSAPVPEGNPCPVRAGMGTPANFVEAPLSSSSAQNLGSRCHPITVGNFKEFESYRVARDQSCLIEAVPLYTAW